jgi:hypothetical protein
MTMTREEGRLGHSGSSCYSEPPRQRLFLAELKEGKNIPVAAGNCEAPRAIVYERRLFHKRRAPLLEVTAASM